MNITQEHIFQAKQELQQQIEKFEKELAELQAKQQTIQKVELLAESIIQYNAIQREISDRAYLFSLLSSPPENLRSPFVKSEFFAYLEAAETIGPDFVNFLIDDFLTQLRADLQADDDNSVEIIQAEYKEYILPGKIIAERFNEIDDLISEMNRFCRLVDQQYDESAACDVLTYAFQKSINADTRMEPTINALREMEFQCLTQEARAELLRQVDEHLAILRYDDTKNQNLAMEKAIKMMGEREKNIQ